MLSRTGQRGKSLSHKREELPGRFRMGKQLKSHKNRQVSMVKVADTPRPKMGTRAGERYEPNLSQSSGLRSSSPVHRGALNGTCS